MAANPKRVMQMLWLAAGILFTFAVLHSFGGGSQLVPSAVKNAISRVGDDHGRISLKEHMALAEETWRRSVQARHDMLQKDWNGDISKMPIFPAVDNPTYMKWPYTIWDFTPATYSCPHEMERVGRLGDGGKWVCGMSKYVNYPKNRQCVIYSFGVRDESSFEEEMLGRTNCSVWAYDFSVVDFGEQLTPANRDRAHFVQAGIAGKTDSAKSPPYYSISDLMKQNGHTYVDILKMDIEYWEFEALEGLMNDFPAEAGFDLPIGQLMVEIHFFHGHTADRYLKWWELLEARGLRPTWTEPNLLAVTLFSSAAPLLAEYTMLNVHDKQNVVFNR